MIQNGLEDTLPQANGPSAEGNESGPEEAAALRSRGSAGGPGTLVIRPGAIGDAIVSLPAVERLRPAEIWCPEQNIPLFEHIAPARSLVAEGLDSLQIPQRTLERLARFGRIVSWYGAQRDDFRAQVRGLPFEFHRAIPPEGCPVHAVDYYLEQVGAPPGAKPRLPFRAPSAGYAVIHPFSGSPRKNWPLERFRAVAQKLDGRLPVFWCAGPEEELPDAVRFADLRGLARWLAAAAVYIGNDSGISHLAAACGVPVIALFGPTDPRVWAPRGRVCVLPFEAPPEDVAEAALGFARPGHWTAGPPAP
ncbi:MAG: glycosyltransferase family 9 protein [Bryobacteraceae bacterium]|nr:glycosyltransferase family 9 protein [Bryobacteraceae bacterium]MCX7604821.1 glycosyltransferase family 9 protein [Bryobacteraceae bacterium]